MKHPGERRILFLFVIIPMTSSIIISKCEMTNTHTTEKYSCHDGTKPVPIPLHHLPPENVVGPPNKSS